MLSLSLSYFKLIDDEDVYAWRVYGYTEGLQVLDT